MIPKNKLILFAKGFSMGVADIVPGVSGGTIALVTGIYDELIKSISSINKSFFQNILKLNIKEALNQINIAFLLPLICGIGFAIISMSRIMHFFMSEYSVYTWSLFFGLILSSIIYISKTIEDIFSPKKMIGIILGSLIGYAVVSLIPVQTSEASWMIFLSGSIAICAMILPGISGSFILLILGKYLFVTSAIKNPFLMESLSTIATFGGGCIVGLLLFSKLLNYLLNNFHGMTMAVLTGFMVGSMKKIWPWKEVLETTMIRGKVHVLKEMNIVPSEINTEVILAVFFMILGVSLVLILEKMSKKSI